VGLRVDHVPAGPLWARLKRQGSPDEEAPEPPWSLRTCRDDADMFRSAALRAGLTARAPDMPGDPDKGMYRACFVENYPVPTRVALPPVVQLGSNGKPYFYDFIAKRAAYPGLEQLKDQALATWSAWYTGNLLRQLQEGPAAMSFWNLGFRLPPRFEAGGIQTWQAAFEAFDTQGDLNSQLVWAEDGYAARADLGNWQNPPGQIEESLEKILSRPKRLRQLRDVFSALLLLRPDAVQWLREWAPHVRDSGKESLFPNGITARDRHGFGGFNSIAFEGVTPRRASLDDFKPTQNIPQLWSLPQCEQYARMPTLAFLHRPGVARFTPALSAEERGAALDAALTAALEGPLREQPPKRLFYSAAPGAAGSDGAALLERSLAKLAPQSGLLTPGAGFRLEQCLGGDLGAASMNAAIGLAAIAVWDTNEPALAVNLRDADAALVFALTPPGPEYRERQHAQPYVI
jgi:hypothetical protein